MRCSNPLPCTDFFITRVCTGDMTPHPRVSKLGLARLSGNGERITLNKNPGLVVPFVFYPKLIFDLVLEVNGQILAKSAIFRPWKPVS